MFTGQTELRLLPVPSPSHPAAVQTRIIWYRLTEVVLSNDWLLNGYSGIVVKFRNNFTVMICFCILWVVLQRWKCGMMKYTRGHSCCKNGTTSATFSSGPCSNDDYLGHSKNHDWLIDWLTDWLIDWLIFCTGVGDSELDKQTVHKNVNLNWE